MSKKRRKRRKPVTAEQKKSREKLTSCAAKVAFGGFRVDEFLLSADELRRLPKAIREQREWLHDYLSSEADEAMYNRDFPAQGTRAYEERMNHYVDMLYHFSLMEWLHRGYLAAN